MQEFDIIKHYSRFNGHGNGIILKGRVRSGKTTLVGILTYILVKSDFYIITNVRFEDWVFEKFADRIYYITNDIEYLEAYTKIPEGGRSILFFDDAQANTGMTSKGVMSEQGNRLSTFLIFIGKLETNYMYIAHQKYLPAPLIEGFNPIMLYTLEIGSFYASDKIVFDEELITRYGYKIETPDPKEFGLPIISRAVARFTFKLDWEDLIEYMARYDVGSNLKEAIFDYIEIYNLHEEQQSKSSPFNTLKSMSYEKILLALSLKKGYKLSAGETIGDLFNPNIRQMVRDQLDEMGYKDK
jgi:hypothetical protein